MLLIGLNAGLLSLAACSEVCPIQLVLIGQSLQDIAQDAIVFQYKILFYLVLQ
jgi:hypothetical protein